MNVRWKLVSGKMSKLHARHYFSPFLTACGKTLPLHFQTVGRADAKNWDRKDVCGKCFDV